VLMCGFFFFRKERQYVKPGVEIKWVVPPGIRLKVQPATALKFSFSHVSLCGLFLLPRKEEMRKFKHTVFKAFSKNGLSPVL